MFQVCFADCFGASRQQLCIVLATCLFMANLYKMPTSFINLDSDTVSNETAHNSTDDDNNDPTIIINVFGDNPTWITIQSWLGFIWSMLDFIANILLLKYAIQKNSRGCRVWIWFSLVYVVWVWTTFIGFLISQAVQGKWRIFWAYSPFIILNGFLYSLIPVIAIVFVRNYVRELEGETQCLVLNEERNV